MRYSRHRRVGLKLVGLTTVLLLIMGVGTGLHEYRHLQAKHHFANLQTVTPVPDVPVKKNTVAPRPTKPNLPGTFNVLLMGSDARPDDTISHSDTLMMVHVDLNHHLYSILSLPRDARSYSRRYGYTKLNTIQFMNEDRYGAAEGVRRTVADISQLTGVPIHFYAETNFYGLKDMIDAVGGIEMDLPYDIRITHPLPSDGGYAGRVFKKGQHFFNGDAAIEVVRERYSVPGGDYARQQMQANAVIALVHEATKPRNLTRLPRLAASVRKLLVATNLRTDDLVSLGLAVKSDFRPNEQVHYFQIPSIDTRAYDQVLHASNDELLLDAHKLQWVVQTYFLGSAAGAPPTNVPANGGGAPVTDAPANRARDFRPLGGPRR
ncbi:LCP family protein [Alicyclobacillus sp. ALC3]|uniref:LCP family protein n=1 Tax=Alicyclobacillus sp. ALC3 TaxID=2796143 RepID=UPI002379DB6C|nr:LCP family protein [Alicyclobacillus sp. ALC3]WDL95488.1 LCP family protein [Alicyclobacillus sp. ALC3]